MKQFTIGVDPQSDRSAVAVIEKGKLVELFMIRTRGDEIYKQLSRFKDAVLIIEDQFLHVPRVESVAASDKNRRWFNPRAFKVLAKAAARIEAVAEVLGWPVITIHPSTWQTDILGIRPFRGTRSTQIKQAARNAFNARWGKEFARTIMRKGQRLNQHLVDASLLTAWYVESRRSRCGIH